jgi:hypothetical protein
MLTIQGILRVLRTLRDDVELCELELVAGRTPSYDCRGTLRVNMEVVSQYLDALETLEQRRAAELCARAEAILAHK